MSRSILSAAALLLCVVSSPSRAQQADSAEVSRVVERFHDALARGDSAAALAQLAPDAVILESGSSETVADYRSHHLPADIEYARAVKSVRTPTRVAVQGGMAWVSATSVTQGTFKERPVNSAGVELMVLVKTTSGWRISAIHWSSRRRS
ncbi:MAG: nuclear transport factor 2 family protein [Gemmatimonadaceae bacterium]